MGSGIKIKTMEQRYERLEDFKDEILTELNDLKERL